MKKILLLVCFGWFLMNGLFAQEIDFTVKTDSVTVGNSKIYTVSIEVLKGNGPFSYYILDRVPWNHGTVIKQQLEVSSSKYVFSNISLLNTNMVVCVKGTGENEFNWKFIIPRRK